MIPELKAKIDSDSELQIDKDTVVYLDPQLDITGWNVYITFPSEYQIHAKRLYDDLKIGLKELTLIGESDTNIDLLSSSFIDLGTLFQWIAINRHPKVIVKIQAISKNTSIPALSFSEGPDPVGNDVQGYPVDTQYPSDRIGVSHLHVHFNENNEKVALRLFLALNKFLLDRAMPVSHKRVWYSPNGPHLRWSWDIHLSKPEQLSQAVSFIMINKPEGLSALVHARTHDFIQKNEWDDHAHRLAWIGEIDSLEVFDPRFFEFRLPLKYQKDISI